MTGECVFCEIIEGKIETKKIYEDDICVAILDISPCADGHTLLMPKEHHSVLPQIPDQSVAHMLNIAQKISAAQLRGLKADGTNIFIANGQAAGQTSPHFMIHIIPRKKDDGITAFNLTKNTIVPEEQEKLRAAIQGKVTL